jgi:hypothetical protein
MKRRIQARKPSKMDVARHSNLIRAAKAAFSFMFLLGITWVFGAIAVDEATLAFFYLFAILNSLQGLFLFIFHCASDDKFVPFFVRG